MTIPSQFTIKDLVNYTFHGFAYILVFITFMYFNFSDKFTESFQFIKNINPLFIGFIALLFSYCVGAGLRNVLPPIFKLCYSKSPSRYSRLYAFITGLKLEQVDHRLLDNSYIGYKKIELNIQKYFDVDYNSIVDKKNKLEVFYMILRFIESKGLSNRIDRLHFITNFHSRIFDVLRSIIILLVVTFFHIQFTTKSVNISTTLISIFIALFALRYTSKILQKSLDEWWKNVWRTFCAIDCL